MLHDFGVKFEASAIVTAPNMRADQIREILRRTERIIMGDGVEEEDFVVAKIMGTLRGSFVTGTSSHFTTMDSTGLCNSVVSKSKHTKSYHHFRTKY